MLSRILIIMTLALALVACGIGEDSASDTADDVAIDVEESVDDTEENDNELAEELSDRDAPQFVMTVSGAEEFEFETSITFGCRGGLFSAVSSSVAPAANLYLPSNIEVGTYPLADYNASADPIYVDGSGVVAITGEVQEGGSSSTYVTATDGEIVIDAIPEEPGQPFLATVTGTLVNSVDESIDFTLTYNLQTEVLYYVDCEF